MSQWDPQARSSQQRDRMQEPRVQPRPPEVRIKDRMRILTRLGRQAPWTWPAAMLLVVLSHPVLAQSGPALTTDITPGQSTQAIFGFPATATNAVAYRVNGMLLIAAALMLMLMLIPVSGRRRHESLVQP